MSGDPGLLGALGTLLVHDGQEIKEVDAKTLLAGKTVGLYFSAHW